MVCNRCIVAVAAVFDALGYQNFQTGMGWVTLAESELGESAKALVAERLHLLGFELIDDRKSRLIEAIKNLVIQKIQHENLYQQQITWSVLIANALHYDYKYLSMLFSGVEGVTIEQFIILQKIEKAKELVVYDELSLTAIADRLGYSSVAHLSNQFKKVTGLSPSQFKLMKDRRRNPIEDIGKAVLLHEVSTDGHLAQSDDE